MPVSRTTSRSVASSPASPATPMDTVTEPCGGELHRVPDQVGEHLADLHRVPEQPRRHRGIDVQLERDALLVRLRLLAADDPLRDLAQVQRPLLQLRLAGRDLAEVEDVVDEREQAVRRRAQRADVLPLALGQLGGGEQVGDADDRVQRRADLVADDGDELRLRPVRPLRRLPRAHQLALVLPPLAGVAAPWCGCPAAARRHRRGAPSWSGSGAGPRPRTRGRARPPPPVPACGGAARSGSPSRCVPRERAAPGSA